MFKKWCWIPALLACVSAPLAFSRNLFSSANDVSIPTITALTVEPLNFAGTIAGPGGTFQVLSAGNANKYYAVSRTTGQSIGLLEGAFPSLQLTKQFSLGQATTAAAVSPDGRRLIMVGGNAQILDTATDTVVGNVNVGTNPIAVAVSLDSTRAFVLSSDSNRLTAIDLSTNAAVTETITIPGQSTAVSVGPNGLVYVSAVNALYEIDGRTMTNRATISLNGLPGKPSFSPDGRFALVPNSTTLTGSGAVAFYVNLTDRNVTLLPNTGFTLDEVAVTDINSAYGFSMNVGRLYFINLANPGVVTPVSIPGATIEGVRDIVASNEAPRARYLFVSTTSGVVRIDLQTNTPTSAGSGAAGNLSYAGPPATGPATSYIQINNNQTVPSGQQSLPLIVRAVDAAGTPLSGVAVTFSTPSSSGTLTNASTQTNLEGYAQATLSIPTTLTTGTLTVTASVGGANIQVPFTVTVGESTGSTPGTGTPAPAAGGLRIIQGQGQVLPQNFTTVSQEPIILELRDAQGNVVPNVPIVFNVTSGLGTVNPSSANTDASGRVTVNFTANVIPSFPGYLTNTISASTGTETVTIYVTTVANQQGGTSGFAQATLQKPVDRVIFAKAGELLPAAIEYLVFSSNGSPLPNVGLRIVSDPANPTAACSGGFALSDASGVVRCDLTTTARPGDVPITVVLGSFRRDEMTLRVSVGAPSVVVIEQGNNQTGNSGQQLPLALRVRVTDAGGNPTPGADVVFEVVTPGTVTLSQVSPRTDASGAASALATLGQIPGAAQVRVRAGTGTATFTLNVNLSATALEKVSGDTQVAIQNQAFTNPLSVRVRNAQNQPVAGAQVAFAVASGSATVTPATATTNADGVATATVTAGATSGPVVVNATIGTLTASFNLTVRTPGPVFTAASFVSAGGYQPGISPGSIAVITAPGIATALRGSITPPTLVGPLPTRLSDVEVLFNNVLAPIYAVSNVNNQETVIVQVPFETTPGQASVTIRLAGGGSTTVDSVQILPIKPGIFEYVDTNGRRYAVAIRPDGSYVSSANPARRGEIIRAYATGLGQTSPSAGTNRAGIDNQTVSSALIVGVNNEGVRLVSAEMMPGAVGIYLVAFEVPLETTVNNAAPFAIAAVDANGNSVFGNGSAIPVQ